MEPSKEFTKFLSKYNDPQDFIENLFLKSVIDSYSRVCLIENISDFKENEIRNEFQKDLIYSNKFIKDFINQNFVTFIAENQIIDKDKELRRTDIAFIINPVIKFVVECKRLSGVSKSQYIDDGISRFINHTYIGANERFAGMCSFVVGGEITNIIKKTLLRIEEYHWLNTGSQKICKFENSFTSNHTKIDKNRIKIYHVFFDMKE